jgi:anti-sigma factor RsiW
MITRMPRSCVVHRAALLDFVDGQPRTPASAAALGHLERCRACEEELAGIVRTIAGLRSLARSLDGVEPGPESWPILRARVLHAEPSPWRWSHSLGGVIATAAIALLVMPWIGSSPVRQPTGFDTPAGLDARAGSNMIDHREHVLPSPLVRPPRAAGAGAQEPPRAIRSTPNGPSRVPVDGEPFPSIVFPLTTRPAPDPSVRRPVAGRPIDAI